MVHWTVFSLLATGLLLTVAGGVEAVDPDFVGVLAIAVDDSVAQRLGLSDETRQQLRELIDKRMNAAVSLALSIKDLPPEERARRLAPFVKESEQLGMKLLSLAQRSKLNQLRLQRGGMGTLAEPNMVQLLQFSAEQQEQIKRLMSERNVAMTHGGATQRRRTRDTYERSLRAVLTSSQKATWDQMAGLGPGPKAIDQPIADSAADDAMAKVPSETAGAAGSPGAPETTPKAEPSSDQEGAGETASTAALSDQPKVAGPETSSSASAPQSAASRNVATAPREIKLRFNFRFAPWEDVLDWLAEQADLSLQSSLVPEGTFNYSDSREYTPTDAIDLINGVLLNQGYTLVRRGRLLTVMDLEEEVPDVLVEFVPVEKLDERGEFELIKTVFQVARLEPADIAEEISQLLGPGRSMVVMPKARQILVTETAGKLRTIRDVIERAENPASAEGGLTEFTLQHISPEEVLGPARALLGLGEGENSGEGISIAEDSTGTRLFANGTKENIQILTDLVERLDKAHAAAPSAIALEQPQLMTHAIHTADPTEALAVIQTLLAGLPDVRMSLDPKTNKIIALARPSEHKTIQETIKQLEGEAPRFEVIQLKRIDPQMAVVAIGNFFSNDAEGESTIKIDADPTSMRLYIRATESEIADIKSLIDKLEGPVEGSSDGGTVRFIPLGNGAAESAVETARRLWMGPNKIDFSTPSESGPSIFDLKEVNPGAPATPPTTHRHTMPSTSHQKAPSNAPAQMPRPPVRRDKVTMRAGTQRMRRVPVRFVSYREDDPAPSGAAVAPAKVPGSTVASDEAPQQTPKDQPKQAPAKTATAFKKGADIRVEFTPNGVLIASEDTEALDKFESLLRQVAGPQVMTPGKNFTVFFLKYCKAEVASQLISDILGGTSSDGGGGSLVGDVAANLMGGGGGILGAILGGGGGGGGGNVTTVQATGPVSIVADSRLNCLVVQALPVDLQLMEQLLKVIDREGSITDIQTAGKPRIIQIVYMNAEDVANVVREAYADRIAQSNSRQGGGQPNPADLIRALRGGRGGRGSSEVKSEPPKLTVAVDPASNSLIVTAPEQLFEEVRQLVYDIDQSNSELTEEVEVVTVTNANPEAIQKALASIMGQTTSGSSNRTSSNSSSRPGSSRSPTSGSASSGNIQARIDAFRRMQAAGALGGRPGGTPGATSRGGSSRGGFSGRPSSGGRAPSGSTRGRSSGGRSRRGR